MCHYCSLPGCPDVVVEHMNKRYHFRAFPCFADTYTFSVELSIRGSISALFPLYFLFTHQEISRQGKDQRSSGWPVIHSSFQAEVLHLILWTGCVRSDN